MRDSIIFYRSYYEALRDLPRDIQGEIYTAIMEYGLYGKETDNLKPVAKSIFTLIKPNLDANQKRYENGKNGGRPKNQTETKPKPNHNQTKTKPKPNKELDKELELDKDKDEELELEREKPPAREAEKFAPLNANDMAFADFYRKAFKTDFIWQENTSEAIQRLADCITDKGGDMETMPNNITRFLEACYRLNDQWLNQRFTPSLLAKQFNQLYQRITTNGNRQTATYRQGRADNPTGVSEEYLAKIAAELGGGI